MAPYRDSSNSCQNFHLRDINGSATPPPISTSRRIIHEDEDRRSGHSAKAVNALEVRSPNGQLPYRSQSFTRNTPTYSSDFSKRNRMSHMEARSPPVNSQRPHADETGSFQHDGSRYPATSPLEDHRSREAIDYFNRDIDEMSISKQTSISTGSGRLPDFFGPGIFQVVLHNPTTAHQMLKFSQARYCSENVEFLAMVEQYYQILSDLTTTMTTIHRDFISPQARNQINLPDSVMKQVHLGMKTIVTSTLPAMEQVFSQPQEKVEDIVFTDIYPRFVRYQMTLNAARALANDRGKYQGLGDCFCLTDPSKADNPIVYASDGFVKVTGYNRKEVVPRNCRFLQGQHTDREPVRRLKTCIDERKESVELLLNYKKNGEPFWNLLYVAPLYNAAGKVVFFIGGQINCSTTIHTSTDVMRILSTSSDIEDNKTAREPLPPTQTGGSRKNGFLSAFRSREQNNNNALPRDVGMEQDLLNKIEGKDLKSQMNAFYTAYSKYVVVRYETFLIEFYSSGVIEMLNPTNHINDHVVGNEIFKFLKANGGSSGNSDYKTRVRNSLKGGYPVSVEVSLETRRSALFRGHEKFMTHWTPLKDENSAVNYVVITLSPLLADL